MFGFLRSASMQIAWFAICVLAGSMVIVYIARAPSLSCIVLACVLLVCIAIFAYSTAMQLSPSPERMVRYAQTIHVRIQELVANHYNLLVPRHADPETAQLRIEMIDGAAVITRIGWEGATRQYEVCPTGRITRHLIYESDGPQPTLKDKWWLHGPLTLRRLEYIVHVLQHDHTYSPRQRITSST